MRKLQVPMTIATVVLAGAAMLAISADNANSEQGKVVVSSAYGFEWQITPLADAEQAFDCVLKVRDLRTNEIMAQPRLRSRWGEEAQITQGDKDTGDGLVVTVVVDESGRTAQYRAELMEAGHLVAVHAATVTLAE